MKTIEMQGVNGVEATVEAVETKKTWSRKTKPIDPAKVAELFEMLPDPSVDPIRPFRWRDHVREQHAQARRKAMSERATTQPNGDQIYALTKIDGRKIYNHRITWILTHGSDVAPGLILDHINRNHLDNRVDNLREVSQAENVRNAQRRGVRNGDVTTSKYRGVTFDKRGGRWNARITINGIRTCLGYYETERLAAYIHDAVKLCLLLRAGGHGLPVLGVNACDPDSDITVRDIWSFIGRARHEYGIDLDKILDRVASRSSLH